MQKYVEEFEKMVEIRGLAKSTLKSYISYLKEYLTYVENQLSKDANQVTWEETRDYILHLKNNRLLNPRTINAHISQLRFFNLYILHKQWDYYQVPKLKFDTYLPFVLSQEDTLYFINTMENLKHKAIVSLLYSAGLRVSEVCKLKYEDINRKKMTIHIRPSKNRSERYAILSEKALTNLTEYWFAFKKPKDWLFPSSKKEGQPIVTKTVNTFIKDHEEKLKWKPRISSHTMRHCFGSHLYENGVDIVSIKNALGHKSINSTMIYVHLNAHKQNLITSPFDKKVRDE